LRLRYSPAGGSFIDNIRASAAEVQIVRRLHFVLAWSECVRATWILAGGQLGPAAVALAAAFRFLDQGARFTDSALQWRPILAPHHGLMVGAREEKP
jgi:hypothetical protein